VVVDLINGSTLSPVNMGFMAGLLTEFKVKYTAIATKNTATAADNIPNNFFSTVILLLKVLIAPVNNPVPKLFYVILGYILLKGLLPHLYKK
jgi:hypothetical protein